MAPAIVNRSVSDLVVVRLRLEFYLAVSVRVSRMSTVWLVVDGFFMQMYLMVKSL